mmetsp:Transcript_3305/g.3873  ORF Transcript_3305/g.3873 Transcript_3305/m.3873 type:complete len:101 (+) Transcript_3305:597-899(+)
MGYDLEIVEVKRSSVQPLLNSIQSQPVLNKEVGCETTACFAENTDNKHATTISFQDNCYNTNALLNTQKHHQKQISAYSAKQVNFFRTGTSHSFVQNLPQ